MRSRHRVLLLGLLCSVPVLGCRTHVLEEGTYALEVTSVGSDGCGILSLPGALWTADYTVSGNLVRMNARLFEDSTPIELGLSGNYLQTLERFRAEGVTFGVTAPANGQDCLLDRLDFRLESLDSLTPGVFTGKVEIRYEAVAPDRCNCLSTAELRAVHQ